MNIKIRRLIALVFILLFIVIAPMLLLYTAGYRFNYKKSTLEKTGTIIIDSQPNLADVYLDDKKQTFLTPTRLTNVLPGEHQIAIKKNNYYTWQKKLNVFSQKTTFIENIILFKQNTEAMLVAENIQAIFFSPDKKSAVYIISDLNHDYLYLLNLDNRQTTLLYNDNSFFVRPEIIWSDNNLLIFKTDKFIKIISTSFPGKEKNLILPVGITTNQLKNLKWQETLLTYQLNNAIWQYEPTTSQSKKIFELPKDELIMDFWLTDNSIFIIEQSNNKIILTKYLLSETEQTFQKVIELSNQCLLQNKFNNYLILNCEQNINLINDNLDQIIYSAPLQTYFDFLPSNNLLLTQTNQELTTLNLNEVKEPKTITRYSQGLTKAQWHSGNYLVALQNQQLHIIELDDRDGHNIIDLPWKQVTDFSLNSNSDKLYYLSDNNLYFNEIN